jgi:multisubunit Na+/H+ antiporter MnhB subunit
MCSSRFLYTALNLLLTYVSYLNLNNSVQTSLNEARNSVVTKGMAVIINEINVPFVIYFVLVKTDKYLKES